MKKNMFMKNESPNQTMEITDPIIQDVKNKLMDRQKNFAFIFFEVNNSVNVTSYQ